MKEKGKDLEELPEGIRRLLGEYTEGYDEDVQQWDTAATRGMSEMLMTVIASSQGIYKNLARYVADQPVTQHGD